MTELAKSFPQGVSYDIPFDTTTFVRASIDEVYKTLSEAAVLVLIVILVFLQDWMSYSGKDLGEMLEPVPPVGPGGDIAQVVATGPDDRQGSLSDCMATMIHAARERLIITTPYYVPDSSLDAAIRTAARRGVDVTMILPARKGERQLTFTLFFHSLFAVGAFLTGRTVRDALFLEHGDRSQLAWMYVFSAIFVTATGLLYGRYSGRLRRDLMALGSASLFGVVFFWKAEARYGLSD